MVDFILFAFVVAVFFAGFWCGAKFGTVKAMARSVSKLWAE